MKVQQIMLLIKGVVAEVVDLTIKTEGTLDHHVEEEEAVGSST